MAGFLVVCGIVAVGVLGYCFRDSFKSKPPTYIVTVPKSPRPVQPKPLVTLGAKDFPKRACNHYKHEREPINNPWARRDPKDEIIIAAAEARMAKIDEERRQRENAKASSL